MSQLVHAAPVGRWQATFSAAGAIAWRHLYKWIRIPANFMPTFLFPLLFFTAFAGALSEIRNIPGFDYAPGYTGFIFVFSLLQTCTFGGLATGFTIAGDFESGFARRLMVTTQSRLAILLGYLLSTFVRSVLMCAVVTAVAFAAGLSMLGSFAEIVGLYSLALGMSFVGTLWASGIMFRGRTAQVAPAMQMPMFIAIFLSPVYVPYDLLVSWLKTVATYNPITYLLEAGRSLLAGSPDGIGLAVLALVALLAVLTLWGVSGIRAAERAG